MSDKGSNKNQTGLSPILAKVLKTTDIFKSRFFRFRTDEIELPNKTIQPNYYVMEFSDWVNVVAVTPEGKLVMVKQYRHAVKEYCLEIPGGTMEPGSKETPEHAAARELIEETGFVPASIELLGHHQPNPALQNNNLWTYLALGCEQKQKQNLDPYEDIEVLVMPAEEVFELVNTGVIRHSLVIAGLHLAQKHLFPTK